METAIARDVVSQAVLADARDNLADVLSSLAVIIGVVGARLGAHWLDGAAGLAIALLSLGTAIHIAITAGNELLEPNLSESVLSRVRQAAAGVAEVRAVTAVTGHAHGSDFLVELSIEVDPRLEVAQAAALADEVRQAIYAAVPEVGDATVELNTDHVARLRDRLR
jgi:cation diffusion facilitator family transporter